MTGAGEGRPVGLIVAGGKATRMGADKPFVRFRSGILLDAVIARVRPQVETLLLNVRPENEALCRSRYGDTFELLADAFGGEAGPLGGVVAGLQKLPALHAAWLATFPGDAPFLPNDLVAVLQGATGTRGAPVVAVAAGKVQSLCALWPLRCLDILRDGVTSGALRSVWRALDVLSAVRVDVKSEPHAFFNVNTPDELTDAERLAAHDTGQV